MDKTWKDAKFVIGVDYGEDVGIHLIPMDKRSVADRLAQDIADMRDVKQTKVGEVPLF